MRYMYDVFGRTTGDSAKSVSYFLFKNMHKEFLLYTSHQNEKVILWEHERCKCEKMTRLWVVSISGMDNFTLEGNNHTVLKDEAHFFPSSLWQISHLVKKKKKALLLLCVCVSERERERERQTERETDRQTDRKEGERGERSTLRITKTGKHKREKYKY